MAVVANERTAKLSTASGAAKATGAAKAMGIFPLSAKQLVTEIS
jgi:hypothetical protein